MKRTLFAALLASAALVSAQSFAADTYFGDENTDSWVPGKSQQAKAPKAAATRMQGTPVHFGDENDASSWSIKR